MHPSLLPHSTRFSYVSSAGFYAVKLGLTPTSPTFLLPPGITPNSSSATELALFAAGVTNLASISSVETGLNDGEDFGGVCESANRMCDFTLGGYEVAMSMEWACLTQCDMGNFSMLARTVKKSKPVVLAGNGCGENSGTGEEATDKQMRAMGKKMGLTEASDVELLAVLLAIAGPDFFKTYNSSDDYDFESFEGDNMPRFKAAGKLLREGEEKEEGGKKKGGGDSESEEE